MRYFQRLDPEYRCRIFAIQRQGTRTYLLVWAYYPNVDPGYQPGQSGQTAGRGPYCLYNRRIRVRDVPAARRQLADQGIVEASLVPMVR